MKKGLVLCGGGSKGSYEMGAWTALEELGIKFDIVTGTSIGCLNAAMYTQHAYDRCLELWNKIEVGMIMESGFNFENFSIRSALKRKTDLIDFFSSYLYNFGANIKPFWNLMDEYIFEDKIINSDVTFGICCARFPSKKGVEVVANNLKPELIKQYICASASCFPVFPVCKIGKESFIDGGYYDNLPINFALDLGATDLVVVDLSEKITHKEYYNKPFIKYICPNRSLGGFMLFDRNKIKCNMTLGYNDTMKCFGKYIGYRYTFEKSTLCELNCRRFIIDISRIISFNRKEGLKMYSKLESNQDALQILEEYTNKPLKDFDYVLRAAEITAELLEIDYLKVYNLNEFLKIIFDNIIEIDLSSVLDGYYSLKANKRNDFLFKANDKLVLKYLSNKLFGNFSIDEDLIYRLSVTKPNVFISFMLLQACKDYFEELL